MTNVLKSFACAIGALAITAAMSWSLVESTAAAPGLAPVARIAKLTIQHHVWFGQSRPAVLVD
jgi:hypothetical protein